MLLLGLTVIFGAHSVLTYGYDVGITISTNSSHSIALNFAYNRLYKFNITVNSFNTEKVLVQIITQGSLVTLSLYNETRHDSSTTGTTAGIIATLPSKEATFVLVYGLLSSSSNCSRNYSEAVVMSVVELNAEQPIPGGCNMVHSLYYYPMLTMYRKDNFVDINFSPANVGFSSNDKEPVCDLSSSPRLRLLYDVYIVFLPYTFNNISCEHCMKLYTCYKITNSSKFTQKVMKLAFSNNTMPGSKITTLHHKDKPTFSLSTSTCSNIMILLNVRDPITQTSSRYVPTIVFQTNNLVEEGSKIFIKIVVVCLILLGAILCATGHRFFYFESTVFTAILCFLISFVVLKSIPQYAELTFADKCGIISVVVLVGGFLSYVLWWRFGSFRFHCLIIGLIGGFLFSCAIFISPLINVSVFRNQAVFFLSFTLVVLLYVLILSCVSLRVLCILSSSFVGAYIVVAMLGCGVFFCSMMSQIVIMVLNRMTEPEFKQAFVVVPFQSADYGLVVGWAVMFLSGSCIQFWLVKGRPDYPECSYRKRMRLKEDSLESADLLINSDQASNDTDSLSSRGASFTSENYEGDVSETHQSETVGFLDSFNNTGSQVST